jgi:hypothetical protein
MAKLRAAEWVDCVPTLKDRIIGKAQDGRWHKNWAERVAKKCKVGPLAKCPASAIFDPMTEVVWTLAMVIAWIVWRTPDDVRENWDAYRRECVEWRWNLRLVSHDGGREWEAAGGWWELKTRDPATVNRLRLDEAVSDCTGKDEVRKLVTVHDAWEELRNRAAAGELTVAAIRNGDGRPVQIPAHEWAYLEHTGNHVLRDELRFDMTSEPQYRDMRLNRDDVYRLWSPATVSKRTSAGQSQCQRWLEAEMRLSPNRRPKPKGEYQIECMSLFSVGARSFERAWGNAIAAMDATAWRKAGRPLKKSPH